MNMFKSSMARTSLPGKKTAVLISVLKSPEDLELLFRERWYRIPQEYAPRRTFTHIAFYQPSSFGKDAGKIRYYASVRNCRPAARLELMPGERFHPGAKQTYLRYAVSGLRKLKRPVLNRGRERVCFGFTTIGRLMMAHDIRSLFGVPPLENILHEKLMKAGLKFYPEHPVLCRGRCRYRLDFALFCRRGKLDIECDGRKWHSNPAVRKKDAARDAWLRRMGWNVIRLSEKDIIRDMRRTMLQINKAVGKLGKQDGPHI
ncbi:MAG: DUF559 domain-containing protein [bacterium]